MSKYAREQDAGANGFEHARTHMQALDCIIDPCRKNETVIHEYIYQDMTILIIYLYYVFLTVPKTPSHRQQCATYGRNMK